MTRPVIIRRFTSEALELLHRRHGGTIETRAQVVGGDAKQDFTKSMRGFAIKNPSKIRYSKENLCAEHAGRGTRLCNLAEVKHELSPRGEP